jgi:hypothetical protein
MFGKIASPTTYCIDEGEREMRENCNKLLSSALSQLMSLREKKKNSFIYKAILKINV